MKLTIASLMLLLMSVAVWGAPVLSIQPVSSVAVPGDTLFIDVNVASITGLAAVQFDITFTSAVLSASMITEGPFLSGGGATFFIPGTIDNIAGVISATADALIGLGPGVSGTGTLARIQFTDIAPGPASIGFANVLLLDSTGSPIDVITQGATVNSPEPSYAAVMMLVLTAGALVVRRRRRVFGAVPYRSLQASLGWVRRRRQG